jgi:hypothetical protein
MGRGRPVQRTFACDNEVRSVSTRREIIGLVASILFGGFRPLCFLVPWLAKRPQRQTSGAGICRDTDSQQGFNDRFGKSCVIFVAENFFIEPLFDSDEAVLYLSGAAAVGLSSQVGDLNLQRFGWISQHVACTLPLGGLPRIASSSRRCLSRLFLRARHSKQDLGRTH